MGDCGGKLMSECNGTRKGEQCGSTRYRCEQCKVWGCSQSEPGECTRQAFVGFWNPECLTCGKRQNWNAGSPQDRPPPRQALLDDRHSSEFGVRADAADSVGRFSFRRDFKRVDWTGTFRVNFARAICSGIVWQIPGLIFLGFQDLSARISYFFIWPVMYLTSLFVILLFSWIPFSAVILLPWVLVNCIGDPIVYILVKRFPNFFRVEKFGFLNFTVFIFVVRRPADGRS